jgi:hypothetical protein
MLGVVCAGYFDQDTQSLVTLNFRTYTDAHTGDFALGLKCFIVGFPAVLVTAGFPLNVIALANNLDKYLPPAPAEGRHLKTKIGLRALVVFPPLVGAFLEPNASTVLTITGPTLPHHVHLLRLFLLYCPLPLWHD